MVLSLYAHATMKLGSSKQGKVLVSVSGTNTPRILCYASQTYPNFFICFKIIILDTLGYFTVDQFFQILLYTRLTFSYSLFEVVGNPAPSVRGCVGNPTLIAICP